MNTLQLEIQNLPQIFKPEKQTQSTASETRNKRDKFLNENFLKEQPLIMEQFLNYFQLVSIIID